jgi:hypothetical protein
MQTTLIDQQIDQAHLTDLVQKALDRPKLEIADWKIQPVQGGFEWDSAVFRLQGQAKDAGETLPWSLILKAIRSSKKAENPGGIWYWKREALAYQSGLLQRLPGGNLTTPACYEVQERPDGAIWLWMEDIRDDVPNPWTVAQYAVAARHLGQFNGAYLTGQAIPPEPWIPRNWLRMYVEHSAEAIAFIRKEPYHPVVQNMLPGIAEAQVLAAWDEHAHTLDVLESLPQVFCHQDAFRRNLFARGGKTVAIDWGYLGNAPVGAELVALIAASLGFFEIPAEQVLELDRQCFEGYLQGLREAGWTGNPRLVRTGYAVTLLLRYPVGGQVGEALPAMLDQAGRSHIESAFTDKTAAELEKVDPAIMAYYQKMLPEAFNLLGLGRMLRMYSRISLHALRLSLGKKKAKPLPTTDKRG